jgi:AcrR family transcriptional regulator
VRQTGQMASTTEQRDGSPVAPRASAGRPRDPRVDQKILEAARSLLAEVGYEATTIQGIAKRSGVSAPAIYRRWSTKPALIEDAVFHLDEFALPEPTGDLLVDLRAWTGRFLDMALEPSSRAAVPGLMSAYSLDPESYSRLLDRGETPARTAVAQMLTNAAATGHDAIDGYDADIVFDLLRGAVYMRALTHGDADSEEFCDRLTKALYAVIHSG